MEETWDPVQAAIACQEVRVKVPEDINDDFNWKYNKFDDILMWQAQNYVLNSQFFLMTSREVNWHKLDKYYYFIPSDLLEVRLV